MEVKATVNAQAGWTPFQEVGPGVPNRISATARGAELPFDVDFEVALAGSRYRIDELRCRSHRGAGITGEGLRKLPLAQMLRMAVLSAPTTSWLPGMQFLKRSPEEIRRGGPTDEALQGVATIYRVAHLIGDPPADQVASSMKLPRSTAGRWIQMARRRGFLGAGQPRRSGERGPRPRQRRGR